MRIICKCGSFIMMGLGFLLSLAGVLGVLGGGIGVIAMFVLHGFEEVESLIAGVVGAVAGAVCLLLAMGCGALAGALEIQCDRMTAAHETRRRERKEIKMPLAIKVVIYIVCFLGFVLLLRYLVATDHANIAGGIAVIIVLLAICIICSGNSGGSGGTGGGGRGNEEGERGPGGCVYGGCY